MKSLHVAAAALALAVGALAPLAARASAPAAGPKPVLDFIDDYAKALAQARARKLPIFVESWAPW